MDKTRDRGIKRTASSRRRDEDTGNGDALHFAEPQEFQKYRINGFQIQVPRLIEEASEANSSSVCSCTSWTTSEETANAVVNEKAASHRRSKKRKNNLSLANGLGMLAAACFIAATVAASPLAILWFTQESLPTPRKMRRSMAEETVPVVGGSISGVSYLSQDPPTSDISGILFLAHGCGGDRFNWFEKSKDCPECSGFPEERAIVDLARDRGMIVVAVSSNDENKKCWLNRDGPRAAKVLKLFQKLHPSLPLFGFGSSSGAEQVGRFLPPALVKTDGSNRLKGIILQNKAPRDAYERNIPAVYIKLPRDQDVAQKIEEFVSEKRQGPTKQIDLPPYRIDEAFFHQRVPYMFSLEVSRQILDFGLQHKLVDEKGYLLRNPLSTVDQWRTALKPLTANGNLNVDDEWLVIAELNVVWGYHATTRDGVAAALDWLLELAESESKKEWEIQG